MAVSVAAVRGANYKDANKTVKVLTLTFSGNYATGGETFGPRTTGVGLRRFDQVIVHGPAMSTDRATAVLASYDHTAGKVVFYESGASGAALAEKTNGEAYPTGCACRVTVVGF